jgi:hypothetical protein
MYARPVLPYERDKPPEMLDKQDDRPSVRLTPG